jgi:hypothetical protein
LQVTPSAVRLASGDAVPSDGEVLRPIRRGVVHDWDALESVYHHIFYEQARRGPPAAHARAGARLTHEHSPCAQLGWVMGEEGSVLVAEPLLTSKARETRCASRRRR